MLKRWIIGVPGAVMVTGLLGIAMMKMIAVEFKAEPVSPSANYEINPKVEEIKLPEKRVQLEKRNVIIPPAPPIVERTKSDLPARSDVIIDTPFDDFTIPPLPNQTLTVAFADTNAQPLLRFPAPMPARATKSGHCTMRFNVSAQGQPYDVQAISCSEDLFKRGSIKATQKFKYRPKMLDGHAVSMRGVQTVIRYNLLDEQGRLIAE